jgi:competence protein ComEC
MIAISEWSAGLPGAWFYIAAPSLLFLALYYALLIGVAAGLFQRERVRVWASAVLGITSVFWLVQLLSDRSTTRLTILPLNGGDAVYFEPPGRKNRLLVDCGNEAAADFVVRPFLASRGVNRLPGLLLTHGDLKHFGGVPVLEHAFRVQEILTGPTDFRSAAYRRILRQWQDTGRPMKSIQRGERMGPWRVLHPDNGDRFAQADDAAVVLLSSIRGIRVLLMSDLGKPGQNVLMNRHPDLRADIVVAGLPTQSEPLAEGFLTAVQPRMIVIADAEYPATERASSRLRDRLTARDIPVIYTRESGSVTIEWRGADCELRTISGGFFRLTDWSGSAPEER